MADSSQMASALAAAIESRREYINSKLAEAGPYTLGAVLNYFKPAPDGNSYPLVMVRPVSETRDWYSMPNNFLHIFEFDIYGLVRGMDPDVRELSTSMLCSGVCDVFMDLNMSLNLPTGEIVSYIQNRNGDAYCPIRDVRYVKNISGSNQISTGFRARYKGSVIENANDINAYANQVNKPNEI